MEDIAVAVAIPVVLDGGADGGADGEVEAERADARDRELHTRCIRWIEDSEDYFQSANRRAERDRDYYDGRQWAEEDVKARETVGRAVITMNRIGRKIRFLKGYQVKTRQSPKALPRTPSHENAADVATEGLRYVADYCQIDHVFGCAYENLLIEGIESVEVVAKAQPDGSIDPHVNYLPWDRLIYDPYGRATNFSDARYLGIVTWMDRDEALTMWPDAKGAIEASFGESSSTVYDDRPRWAISSRDRNRVRFVQFYFKDAGEWKHCILTRTGFIDPPAPSPWKDEYGRPECPIIAGAAFINQDNERYGIVREMIDAQDEINVRHSNGIDFSKMRQTLGERGAVGNINETKLELQSPNGHIEVTPGMSFEVLPTTDLSSGNMEALALARNEIEMMGPNASMLGKDTRSPSGRAVIAQQEGGLFEIAPLLDCHRDFELRAYRAIWHRIRQFWKAEKWIRVTDDENKPRFVGVNVPVTYGQLIAQKSGGQVPPEIVQRYGPLLNEQAQVQNPVSYLDVDIILEEVPHSAILQQEQFDGLVDLAKLGAGMGEKIPFKAILQASSIREKDKIIDELERGAQGTQQQQAMQADMLAKKIAAEIENTLASARKSDADALVKTIQAQLSGLQAAHYAATVPPMQPPSFMMPASGPQGSGPQGQIPPQGQAPMGVQPQPPIQAIPQEGMT